MAATSTRILRVIAASVGVAVAATLMPVAVQAAEAPVEPQLPVCNVSIPGLGPWTHSKIPSATSQVMVARSQRRRDMLNDFERWEKINGCWQLLSTWYDSTNGYKGWNERPWSGSLLTPIGVFSITDVGGRLPNPGTAMPYHHGPKYYERGGYKLKYPVQIYNYVMAINYNRIVGTPPRSEKRRFRAKSSGYWIHQQGLGVTRGCIGLTKQEMVTTLQWLRPEASPRIVMGPQASLIQ